MRCRSPSCSRSTATRWPHGAQLQARACARDYERYEFHLVVAAAADVLLRRPGRLLPRHPEGPAVHHRRRFAARAARRRPRSGTSRTALLRLMAPILSFTAEEAWQVAAAGSDDSVFFQHLARRCRAPPDGDAAARASGRGCAQCAPTSEGARGAARGGHDRLVAAGRGRHRRRRRRLRAARAASATTCKLRAASPRRRRVRARRRGWRSRSRRARTPKCERCWHYRADVGSTRTRRCAAAAQTNLFGAGERARMPRRAGRWFALARRRDRGRSTSSTKCAGARAFRARRARASSPPFFNLVLAYNTGAAFSFLAGAAGWQRWFFAAIALAAAAIVTC